MFIAQLRNELWKLFGKKRTYIGFGAFLVVQAMMLLLFRYGHAQDGMRRMLSGNGYLASEFVSALTVSIFMLTPQILFFLPLYTALVGGDLVAKESEDGTLRMILSRPISRARLLLVKWLAGFIFAMILALALGAIALITARILFPWKSMFVFIPGNPFSVFPASVGFQRFLLSHVFLAINAGAMLSVAFLFSCFNMKPAAATVLGFSFYLGSWVLESIPFFEDYQNWFITHHFKCWILVFKSPIPWAQIAQSEILLMAICATAFAIGSMAFQVRDIKS
jgi:ABC-2 type transport system permease protein